MICFLVQKGFDLHVLVVTVVTVVTVVVVDVVLPYIHASAILAQCLMAGTLHLTAVVVRALVMVTGCTGPIEVKTALHTSWRRRRS